MDEELLKTRISNLEARLATYEARYEEERKGQVYQHIIEKYRLTDDYAPMLELAAEKCQMINNFAAMVEEAENLFKGYCKKAGKELAITGGDFQKYITHKQEVEEKQRLDAEALKQKFL